MGVYDVSRFNRDFEVHQSTFETMHTQKETLEGKVASAVSSAGGIDAQQLSTELSQEKISVGRTIVQLKVETDQIKADGTLSDVDRAKLLDKYHTTALKLLDLSNKIEKDIVAVETIQRQTTGATLDLSGKVQQVSRLFTAPDNLDNYEVLRAEIPRPKDPLFEEMLEDSKVVASAKGGQTAEVEKALTDRKATAETFSIVGDSHNPENFQIWSDDPNTRHLAMDHANWKLKPLILDKISTSPSPYEWMNCATKIKTCSSVLHNTEATFCKDEGMLVYLAPKSYEALISAGPHDISSPSEHWKPGDAIYGAALHTVTAYLNDQKKFRLAFDLTSEIKENLAQKLENFRDHPDFAKAEMKLKEKYPSSFEKKYYEGAQPTNLELELDRIITILETIPDLEDEVGCSSVDVQELKRQVGLYLEHAEVAERGTQRQTTTGWELDPTKDRKHALGIEPRTKRTHVTELLDKLKSKQIYINEFAVAGESVDANRASQFAQNNKEQFFRNIFRNTLQGHTLDEAIKIFDEYKNDPTYEKILEEIDAIQRNPFDPDRRVLKPSEVKEVMELCIRLTKEIKEASELAKSTYNEVQLYSSECEIAGFGIKKGVLDELKKYPSIEELVQEKQRLTAEAQTKETEIQRLKGISAPQDQIDRLAREKDESSKKAGYLGGCYDTYKIMVEANRLGLPIYIHHGPK